MPRQPRIDLPGYVYHVIIRGIEKRAIFHDSQDYQEYLRRVGGVLNDCGGKCFAWSLLPNHAHMLIQSGKAGLAQIMRRLLTGYAVYFNKRHSRCGHLFQNRYKATLCDTDEYLHILVRYIHLNPLKAKIVSSLEELAKYRWSGDRVMMDGEHLVWHDVETVLALFGKTIKEARASYRRYMQEGLSSNENFEGGGLLRSGGGLDGVLAKRAAGEIEQSDERILAGGDFVNAVYDQMDLTSDAGKNQNMQKKSLEDILHALAACASLEVKDIVRRSQQRKLVFARAVLAQYARDSCGYTATDIGKGINVSLSGVSRLLSKELGSDGQKIKGAMLEMLR